MAKVIRFDNERISGALIYINKDGMEGGRGTDERGNEKQRRGERRLHRKTQRDTDKFSSLIIT